jgi:hypothetical protein
VDNVALVAPAASAASQTSTDDHIEPAEYYRETFVEGELDAIRKERKEAQQKLFDANVRAFNRDAEEWKRTGQPSSSRKTGSATSQRPYPAEEYVPGSERMVTYYSFRTHEDYWQGMEIVERLTRYRADFLGVGDKGEVVVSEMCICKGETTEKKLRVKEEMKTGFRKRSDVKPYMLWNLGQAADSASFLTYDAARDYLLKKGSSRAEFIYTF